MKNVQDVIEKLEKYRQAGLKRGDVLRIALSLFDDWTKSEAGVVWIAGINIEKRLRDRQYKRGGRD